MAKEIINQADLEDAITNSPTKFYYTNSNTADLAYCLEEAATGETATALAGSNFTSVIHSQGHCYPSGTLAWLNGALA